MASKLEESTQNAKKLAIGCGVAVVGILFVTMVINIFFKEEEPAYYPYPKTVERKFGSLPNLEFESIELKNLNNLQYKLDTVSGELQSFPPVLYVFKTKVPRQSFTASDDAKAIADALEFSDEPKTPTNTLYKWTKGSQTLEIDKLYWTVSLTTEYNKEENINLQNALVPEVEPYITAAKKYLGKAGLLPSGFSDAEVEANYLRMNEKFDFVRATSSSEASFVRVDIFKKLEATSVYVPPDASDEEKIKINKYRIYAKVLSDNPNTSQVYAITGGERGTETLFELKYKNWEVEDISTYQVVSTSDAWEEIKKGKGYLRSIYEETNLPYKSDLNLEIEAFHVTEVELAYYSSDEYTEFILPIYVFKGVAPIVDSQKDAFFSIYYPALKPEGE